MTNQNYDQVVEMYAEGALKWETSAIVALLRTGETFNANDKTVDDLTGWAKASQKIQGKWYSEGLAMGLPATFSQASQGETFQVILVQDIGNANPALLAYIDTNADGSPITIQRTGTLIIRPVLPSIDIPPERPPTIGVWMRLPT